MDLKECNCACSWFAQGPNLSCGCPFCLRFSRSAPSLLGMQRGGGGFFDSCRMGDKSRAAKQVCLRQIAQMSRTHGTESDWSALLREAAPSLSALPVPPPPPDIRDPQLYLDFFRQTHGFASFPHESRRPLAIGSGIYPKSRAWGWICEQICVGASHPEWRRRPLVDPLGALFADLFQRIGDCRLPLCAGPTVAPQVFAHWSTLSDS